MTASILPSTCALVIAKRTYTLHKKDAIDPIATSVSMFGDLCHRLLKPLIKNFWLITMTIPARSSCTRPIAIWLSSNHAGSGHPHIICPMEKYINTSKNPTDAISLRFKTGVSLSSSAVASAPDGFFSPAPFSEAPYPACSTAAMICSGGTSPSTPIELVRRLTEQEVTPGTLPTAFSTLALQAAQLIPVTLYCLMSCFTLSVHKFV